ncbi:MAG: hypothetical protein ACJ8B6_05635, partial [Gemmatimonadales bacterium]
MAAFTIVPRHVLGGPGYTAPSDMVNVALVGAASMGMSNARALIAGGQTIAVLVDVDFGLVDRRAAEGAQPRTNTGANAGNAARPPAGLVGNAGTRAPQPEVGPQLLTQYQKAKRYADVRVML